MQKKSKFLNSYILRVKYHALRIYQILRNTYVRFTNLLDIDYLRKWLTIGILIGIISGIGSIIFYLMINWATHFLLEDLTGYIAPVPGSEGENTVIASYRFWAIPLITTLGGLISGLIVYTFAPEAEGHGTDAAINSFHHKQGRIRKRVPLVKMASSAITIGSGGSAGREGPVALIGAGFGSLLANLFKLNDHDRRIALTAGIGSSIGSIFKAPLGGALLGTEILYRRDFEVDAIFPSFISSIIGYVIFASWNGWNPIFSIPDGLTFNNPIQLCGYAILGLVCGIVGAVYGRTFYKTRDIFKSWKLPNYLKPAIGGLGVGIIGMFLPQVLGMGYGWLQLGINGNYAVFPVYIMAGVILGKIIATSLSIGSGGSGGVFAPGLVIGGMVGGVVWWLLKDFTMIVPPNPGAFVIVGMMALFGGIAKAPLAIMIMVSEMTNSYVLLAPCMIAVVIAYFATGKSFIYENQVPNRISSPAHKLEFAVPLLKRLTIKDAMQTDVISISPSNTLEEVEYLMKHNHLDALPVIIEGNIIGIVANLDLVKIQKSERISRSAREVMSQKLIVGYQNERLDIAMERMSKNNISHLPILDDIHQLKLRGMLCIDDIIRTYRSRTDLTI